MLASEEIAAEPLLATAMPLISLHKAELQRIQYQQRQSMEDYEGFTNLINQLMIQWENYVLHCIEKEAIRSIL